MLKVGDVVIIKKEYIGKFGDYTAGRRGKITETFPVNGTGDRAFTARVLWDNKGTSQINERYAEVVNEDISLKVPKQKATDIVVDKDGVDYVKKSREEIKCVGLEAERKAIEIAIEGDFPVLIQSDTGQGKSYMLSSIAKEHGKQLIHYTLNGQVGTPEFLGKYVLAKDGSMEWQDGVLSDCIRHGKWLHIAELNMGLPEVLSVLNGVLDDCRNILLAEKDGECVVRHPDFRLFASINPPDEYVGTKELNKALLSRFPIVITMSPYKPKHELEILQYQSGVSEELGSIMVDIGNYIRRLKGEGVIWYTCSTRDLVSWARLLMCNGCTLQETFDYAVLNKCSKEDREKIAREINTATAIEFKWTSTKKDYKKLTEELAKDINKLRKEKLELTADIDEIVSKATKTRDKISVD